MKTYEFDGEKYKKASTPQKEWGKSLISEISLQGNEKILDLGCGDGYLTEQLSLLVPNGKVLGIDASVGMIKTAKKICRDNLDFVQMDINNMHFSNEFDIIFSNAALHWVKDHNQLLQNSHTALKTGGILLWNFGSDGNCSNFLTVIQKKITENKYIDFFRDFEMPWFMPSKSYYTELIADIGYSHFTISEVNRDRFFPSSDEIIKWIDQPCIVPFMECIPDIHKSAFRKEVIEEMLERTKQPDGTCFETFRRLQVYAQK
ncbi:MAG: methyltransferase domain-containing protein [Lachnospiraceae bacterium]|nr:methyltransferase domain-containing protein [Lachnospiraceae bacterium]